jgi:hypothetical protein
LETGALVSKLSDSVETKINDFFADGVMATGEIVGCILLSGDELLWVEELAISASADLINDCGFQVKEDATGDMLAGTSLGEEGVEGIIAATDSLIGGHLTVRLDAVLEAEEFPAGVTYLDTGLTDVD